MPRKVRDASLENRTARSRLKVQHKPYFRLIEPGLHVGYRKLGSGPGTWVVRRYAGGGNYAVVNLRTADGALVIADDFAEADGAVVITFAQAQVAARGKLRGAGSYRVADAMDDYFRFLRSDGRSDHSIYDAQRRDLAHVRPKIGNMKLSALTAERLRRWRDEMVDTPPRLRTPRGEEQKYRKHTITADALRARRGSANRTWTTLRAALNHAFRDGKVDTDLAWRKVKPFRSVDSARVRYLTVAEAKRLINACDPDFRPLVRGALETGCRYGELCRLQVHDYNPDVGTVAVQRSKSGKPRHVVLTDDGRAFFDSVTVGRAGSEPMLGEWKASHQLRPMREAVERAKIKPPISFHGLRHTWASHAVMNGVPLMIVARNLGHTDTRMVEKHYGHLAPGYVADTIRKHAPKFGMPKINVHELTARR